VKILNVPYSEARAMTVWEFNHRIKGYADRQVDEWRRLRWLGAIVLRPHTKRSIRPTDLFELPGDDKTIPKPTMTKEERKSDISKAVDIWTKRIESGYKPRGKT
jgi:hypothetical protein